VAGSLQLSTLLSFVPRSRVLIVVDPPDALTTSTNPTVPPESVSRLPPISRYALSFPDADDVSDLHGIPAVPVYVGRLNDPLISRRAAPPGSASSSAAIAGATSSPPPVAASPP